MTLSVGPETAAPAPRPAVGHAGTPGRPAARPQALTIARRSASSAVGQSAISSSVRMQPAHRPEIGSSRHTPMQGEGISIT